MSVQIGHKGSDGKWRLDGPIPLEPALRESVISSQLTGLTQHIRLSSEDRREARTMFPRSIQPDVDYARHLVDLTRKQHNLSDGIWDIVSDGLVERKKLRPLTSIPLVSQYAFGGDDTLIDECGDTFEIDRVSGQLIKREVA